MVSPASLIHPACHMLSCINFVFEALYYYFIYLELQHFERNSYIRAAAATPITSNRSAGSSHLSLPPPSPDPERKAYKDQLSI